MSSSMVKGMLTRPTPNICNKYQRLFNGNSKQETQCCRFGGGGGGIKLHIMNRKSRSHGEAPILSPAILTPPTTPTTKKHLMVSELTTETGMKEEEIFSRIEKLSEVNPMLGFRGCRLGISYPELTEMQARTIFQAAVSTSNHGITVLPEIVVPLIGTPQFKLKELRHQVRLIRSIAEKAFSDMGSSLSYKVGTMIEVPRAALVADEIAKEAEFFSFGTNDLTQMTFGYSRDDVGKFLPIYLSHGILKNDPFEVLDQTGVGELIRICTEKGRAARPNLKVGICGEHGGEPSSVAFFSHIGLDYFSCSPFRVPIARLAAAQVAA